ncbi:hypothetical protein LLH06_07000 [Mucilaginibacter daejeonensis]|uniref:hypothetical protein n=1 Tax=Mucilaginibacter daejeonensis TaxID=398049 RepID=UPI001D17B599|nr:hypothetical protein [Mucilaginibacter daejeonensis]UEG54708.1 hypothetical protein LLH06_07000 [Mucilaginibacter daejeonensis]
MEAFTIKCHIDELETGLIAYPLDESYTRFKLENITGEPDPMFINKDESGHWTIEKSGSISLPEHVFEQCCNELQRQLSQHKK